MMTEKEAKLFLSKVIPLSQTSVDYESTFNGDIIKTFDEFFELLEAREGVFYITCRDDETGNEAHVIVTFDSIEDLSSAIYSTPVPEQLAYKVMEALYDLIG